MVSEVINPRVQNQWKLNENGAMIEDEIEIANTFNYFFVSKIEKLRENINQNHVEDLLEKLRKKMAKKHIKFSLKIVSENWVYKAICSLKKKKSSGSDGLTQEQLVLGGQDNCSYINKNNKLLNSEWNISRGMEGSYYFTNFEKRRPNHERKLPTSKLPSSCCQGA